MTHLKTTKSIRFKLNANGENNLIKQSVENLKEISFDLASFVVRLDDFIARLGDFMYYGDYFKENLSLKTEWVKIYAKEEYAEAKKHANKTTVRQYTIGKYGLADKINDIVCYVDNIYSELAYDASAELNERSSRARTGLLLKKLYSKYALPCLVDLVNNVVDKKEKTNDSLILKSIAAKLLAELEAGIQQYLPEQSNGVKIAKASLNYYTLNKKPIDFVAKIKELSEKMKVGLSKQSGFSNNQWAVIEADIKSRCNGKVLCLGDSPFMEEDKYISLRQELKNILAKQKSSFSEMMQEGVSYRELRSSDLYLFNSISEEEFNQYKKFTDDIEELSTERNQTQNKDRQQALFTKITNLKKSRGALLREFVVYKKFAAWYRNVALNHGRILAQLKAIEHERVESQMLQYWALIAERNNTHQLVLIPKEQAQSCKEYLQRGGQGNGDAKLYWFESFTFRSLQKLCFGNLESGSNSFYQEIKRELTSYYTPDERGYPKFITGEHEFKGNEQRKIRFYKDVLSSRYAGKTLQLPIKELQEEVINKTFDSLEDFKIALEKVCYKRFVCLGATVMATLRERYGAQVFDITSADLRNATQSEGKEDVYSHTDKNHTRIWKEFWSEKNISCNYDVRLNPELYITYRKAKESRISKYGKGSDRYDAAKNNRYLHDQLTLVTTITEHSNSPIVNLAFQKVEEVENNILQFNGRIKEPRFAFGIDNGEVELSTLGVCMPDFVNSNAEERAKILKQVDMYGFKVLTIADLLYAENDINGKEKRLLQNPSYFLNKELYCRTFGKSEQAYNEMFAHVFEEKQTLTVDLSTAKVICGHLVTNGDVTSLFNLWMRHAQRNVYEMNEHSDRKGAKKIVLKKGNELNDAEKLKFIGYINEGNKKYAELSVSQKADYVKWVYKLWNSEPVEENRTFSKVMSGHKKKGNYLHNVLMAVSFVGEELTAVSDVFNIRNIFKLRKDFDSVMNEDEILKVINAYNVRSISDEELDLKLNQMKSSLVANVVGVVDFLYRQYKERFGGEGIIVMEQFKDSAVATAREKFSGNIYRMLERKLYQKFQNYGLVPPVKNLIQIRDEKNLTQIGNVLFVNPEGTSQLCPVCEQKGLSHDTKCPHSCGFDSNGIMHSNDGIAGVNIAKRGLETIEK